MRNSSFAVLRLLADGRFRSGEMICCTLGVSHGAVRLALREIAAHGLKIHSVRHRGYRLEHPFDSCDEQAIRRRLRALGAAVRFELVDECTSTNAVLLQRAARGAPSGAALACELQTAGRGRHGARWLSGLGDALTFSLLWRFTSSTAALGGLPLAIGVACVRALERLGAQGVALKWPNDLVCDSAKLGGILIEATGDPGGACVAVIGIGINVRLRRRLRDAIGQPATDVVRCGGRPQRDALLAHLLAAVAEAAATFARDGFMPFRDAWQGRHALHGRPVRVIVAGQKAVDGIAAGVADDGALLLETPNGVERYHAGEVSMRRAA